MTKNFIVHQGDHVRISLRKDPSQHSEGEVLRIQSDKDPSKITVVLQNGDSGTVIDVINSLEIIKKRILAEGQYTENKENFGERVMRTDVIPKTVQSFLNSEGGYLYIGIRDVGDIHDRLVGLDYDFELLKSKTENPSIDKLCDMLETQIMDTLAKYLTSDAALGTLLKINFPKIQDMLIVEIIINKSPHPWFFRNLTKSNKDRKFEIQTDNGREERTLDDFYIRRGNSKKRLDTLKEFYDYAKGRFVKL